MAEFRVAPLLPTIAEQSRAEFLRLIRAPAFSIPVIVFPVMFFALFGLAFAKVHIAGITMGTYMLASYGAYAVINVALFSFGITVANERAEKTTVLMRATPLHPLAYLGGKVVATITFSALTLLVLFVFAALTAGVRLTGAHWSLLAARLLVGVFPFITLGFAIGYLAGPSSAIAILQLISLPMSFASGIFVPIYDLPAFVRAIAPYLPAYHYAQLAWGTVGVAVEPADASVAWLAGFTIVFLLLAVRAYYREETKTFG